MAPSPTAAWRFLRGVSRGLRMGAFFPVDGRTPGQQAPGGSHEEAHPQGAPDLWGVAALQRSQHLVPLPGLERPIRALHLSDVHLRAGGPWLDWLCAAVASEAADLVLLTGDLVTRGWTEAALGTFLDALPVASLGRFAVLGNWEHWADAGPARLGPLLADHGIRLLVDELVHLEGLRLVGTDDLLAGVPDLPGLRSRLTPGPPTVVLSHSPAAFPALAGPGVDLVLSGHSHGGQVRVPGLGALWVPRGTGAYVAGWYHHDDSWLFVHRGVGWSIAPLRLGCTPELALHELRP